LSDWRVRQLTGKTEKHTKDITAQRTHQKAHTGVKKRKTPPSLLKKTLLAERKDNGDGPIKKKSELRKGKGSQWKQIAQTTNRQEKREETAALGEKTESRAEEGQAIGKPYGQEKKAPPKNERQKERGKTKQDAETLLQANGKLLCHYELLHLKWRKPLGGEGGLSCVKGR